MEQAQRKKYYIYPRNKGNHWNRIDTLRTLYIQHSDHDCAVRTERETSKDYA